VEKTLVRVEMTPEGDSVVFDDADNVSLRERLLVAPLSLTNCFPDLEETVRLTLLVVIASHPEGQIPRQQFANESTAAVKDCLL
jgi:hypothetical protein